MCCSQIEIHALIVQRKGLFFVMGMSFITSPVRMFVGYDNIRTDTDSVFILQAMSRCNCAMVIESRITFYL